ncbi:MAG TPA: thioesterase family protein [Gaiellaceae bacterium]|jgi:acyl-CoA thioester hydrolase|nr:thioesterase family protein [Gaiellaceae bacterium]
MHEYRIQTRWSDFDALGHVTASAYPVFFDEARDASLAERVGGFAQWPSVLVHVTIDYRREIAFPVAEVVVRSRIAEVGRTSITFEQEVVVDGEVRATSRSVLVAWDAEARGSRAITDDERARLL